MLVVLISLLCLLERTVTEKEPIENENIVDNLKNKYGIYGGNTTTIQMHPYAVVINVLNKYYVGAGAIVADQWILTSAFNIFVYELSEVKVRIGSNYSNEGGQELDVEKIIVHEKYDGKFDYNVALIKTKRRIRLGVNTKVIDLATVTPAHGSDVQLCGWGTVSIFDDPQTAHKIKEGNMSVYNLSLCQTVLKNYVITDQNLCATSSNLGTCRFDSGDPLVYDKKLLGLMIGNPTCLIQGPAVFVNVSKLKNWVENQIKNNDNSR